MRDRRTCLLLYDAPPGIGIELARCGRRFCCGLAQVLLQQHAILVDHERHYAGVAVLRRVGDQAESARHLPIDQVLLRAARRFIALAIQHAEVIAVEWGVPLGLCGISFSSCERCQRPSGLAGFPSGDGQYKPFCLPGSLMNFAAYCFAFSPSCAWAKYSACASATAPQTSMIASSFRPIRRFRSSSFPAAKLKNHFPSPFFLRGIGKGKLSGPTSRI